MRQRIETALGRHLATVEQSAAPSHLREALHAAVFPGGARLRPRLLMTVVEAYGDPDPELADAAAVAVELVHCSSLVHDDLPCFDDAALRRGLPTIHRTYGEPTAVLVGDGLIFLAVEALTNLHEEQLPRASMVLRELMRASGPREGLVCGQALESDDQVDLNSYHRAKTGGLFESSAVMGALVVGAEPEPYQQMALELGLAYQIADDLLDHLGVSGAEDKPVSQDVRNNRPNAVFSLGLQGAQSRIESHYASAVSHVRGVPGSDSLVQLIDHTVSRLIRTMDSAVSPLFD